ncbi:hypothetical protein ACNOYE_36795 [Nannocystaceae bacterium ST9]
MTIRTLILALIPCFIVVGCGMDSESEDFRTVPSEEGSEEQPCMVEDCVPLDPGPPEIVCPPHTEVQVIAECIDANGSCEWDIAELCVPVQDGGGDPPPPPEYVPHPAASPRDVAPRPA